MTTRAPVGSYMQATAVRRMDEPTEVVGGDLFEQHDTPPTPYMTPYEAAVKKHEAASAPAVAYAPQGGTYEVASQNSMRGTVYNNAFIPPQPVEVPPESRSRDGMMSGYGPQFENLMVARHKETVVTDEQSSHGYRLRPPVPGSASQPKKQRGPSIFERFTSQLRNHAHDDEDGVSEAAAAPTSVETGLRASQRPLQGSLNIEAPSASRSAEPADDELDIPAFLRRQAN